jgi:hypothetical protein
MDNAHLVVLIQNNWHQIEAELGRWREMLMVPWTRAENNYVPSG